MAASCPPHHRNGSIGQQRSTSSGADAADSDNSSTSAVAAVAAVAADANAQSVHRNGKIVVNDDGVLIMQGQRQRDNGLDRKDNNVDHVGDDVTRERDSDGDSMVVDIGEIADESRVGATLKGEEELVHRMPRRMENGGGHSDQGGCGDAAVTDAASSCQDGHGRIAEEGATKTAQPPTVSSEIRDVNDNKSDTNDGEDSATGAGKRRRLVVRLLCPLREDGINGNDSGVNAVIGAKAASGDGSDSRRYDDDDGRCCDRRKADGQVDIETATDSGFSSLPTGARAALKTEGTRMLDGGISPKRPVEQLKDASSAHSNPRVRASVAVVAVNEGGGVGRLQAETCTEGASPARRRISLHCREPRLPSEGGASISHSPEQKVDSRPHCLHAKCREPPVFGPKGGRPVWCRHHFETQDSGRPLRCTALTGVSGTVACWSATTWGWEGQCPSRCDAHRHAGMVDAVDRLRGIFDEAIWPKLAAMGWRDEVSLKARSRFNISHSRYVVWLPPNVVRGVPHFKCRTDYFDTRPQVIKHCLQNEGIYEWLMEKLRTLSKGDDAAAATGLPRSPVKLALAETPAVSPAKAEVASPSPLTGGAMARHCSNKNPSGAVVAAVGATPPKPLGRVEVAGVRYRITSSSSSGSGGGHSIGTKINRSENEQEADAHQELQHVRPVRKRPRSRPAVAAAVRAAASPPPPPAAKAFTHQLFSVRPAASSAPTSSPSSSSSWSLPSTRAKGRGSVFATKRSVTPPTPTPAPAPAPTLSSAPVFASLPRRRRRPPPDVPQDTSVSRPRPPPRIIKAPLAGKAPPPNAPSSSRQNHPEMGEWEYKSQRAARLRAEGYDWRRVTRAGLSCSDRLAGGVFRRIAGGGSGRRVVDVADPLGVLMASLRGFDGLRPDACPGGTPGNDEATAAASIPVASAVVQGPAESTPMTSSAILADAVEGFAEPFGGCSEQSVNRRVGKGVVRAEQAQGRDATREDARHSPPDSRGTDDAVVSVCRGGGDLADDSKADPPGRGRGPSEALPPIANEGYKDNLTDDGGDSAAVSEVLAPVASPMSDRPPPKPPAAMPLAASLEVGIESGRNSDSGDDATSAATGCASAEGDDMRKAGLPASSDCNSKGSEDDREGCEYEKIEAEKVKATPSSARSTSIDNEEPVEEGKGNTPATASSMDGEVAAMQGPTEGLPAELVMKEPRLDGFKETEEGGDQNGPPHGRAERISCRSPSAPSETRATPVPSEVAPASASAEISAVAGLEDDYNECLSPALQGEIALTGKKQEETSSPAVATTNAIAAGDADGLRPPKRPYKGGVTGHIQGKGTVADGDRERDVTAEDDLAMTEEDAPGCASPSHPPTPTRPRSPTLSPPPSPPRHRGGICGKRKADSLAVVLQTTATLMEEPSSKILASTREGTGRDSSMTLPLEKSPLTSSLTSA